MSRLRGRPARHGVLRPVRILLHNHAVDSGAGTSAHVAIYLASSPSHNDDGRYLF
jgi:hypothetical protein